MKSLLAVSALAIAAFLLPAAARAQTDTADLTVTATVRGNCTIAPSTLVFGEYRPAAALDGAGEIIVTCTQGSRFWIGLGAGLNGASAAYSTSRQMDDDATGAEFLAYELYSDATRTSVWGDEASESPAPVDVITAGFTAQTPIPVYGRIPANQTAAPLGGYADAVVMTVNF